MSLKPCFMAKSQAVRRKKGHGLQGHLQEKLQGWRLAVLRSKPPDFSRDSSILWPSVVNPWSLFSHFITSKWPTRDVFFFEKFEKCVLKLTTKKCCFMSYAHLCDKYMEVSGHFILTPRLNLWSFCDDLNHHLGSFLGSLVVMRNTQQIPYELYKLSAQCRARSTSSWSIAFHGHSFYQ